MTFLLIGQGESISEVYGVRLTVRRGQVIVEDGKVIYASQDADYTLTVPAPWWRAFVRSRFRR